MLLAVIFLGCAGLLAIPYMLLRQYKKPDRAAYILENQVTHCRLLPKVSSHAFTYPTLALLLSLNALESHSLDLARGWIFGYGGLFFRLTGLRSSAYLTDKPDCTRSIKAKLFDVLSRHGYDTDDFCDAWMMTMPSYLGFEGINPLTVYFCYDSAGSLWIVILEVHNTFGERHVYILEPGTAEDDPAAGFVHQWTFARQFHVSPFNDRSGFYRISVNPPLRPPPSPSSNEDTRTEHSDPLPVVRIHFLEPNASPGSPGPLKLWAVLRAKHAVPLTSRNLVWALSRRPFVLLLSMIRILHHAWILHYQKRLDVYPRPEPYPASHEWGSAGSSEKDLLLPGSGGISWQAESAFETYARKQVESFLRQRVHEVGFNVTLVAANPSIAPVVFTATNNTDDGSSKQGSTSLTIWYRAPQFFTILFLSPSAAHALLLGNRAEQLFMPDSYALFNAVFVRSASSQEQPNRISLAQRLRTGVMPRGLFEPPSYSIPPEHFLVCVPARMSRTAMDVCAVWMLLIMGRLERCVYAATGARFVHGQEPWGRWQRALDILVLENDTTHPTMHAPSKDSAISTDF